MTDNPQLVFGSDWLPSQVDVPVFTNIGREICVKLEEQGEPECFFGGETYESSDENFVITYDNFGLNIFDFTRESGIHVSGPDGVILHGDAAKNPMIVEALFVYFGIFWIFHQLVGFTGNTVKEKFYDLKNAKYIRGIAYYLIALPMFYYITAQWKIGIFESEFEKFNITGIQFYPDPGLQVIYMVFGLVVFILSLVFSSNVKLKEEQALTI